MIKLYLSRQIIDEYQKVLEYDEIKEKTGNIDSELIIDKIISFSIMVNPSKSIDIIKEDPSDNKILECAMECNADFLITNDNHLLKLEKIGNTHIITPKEFLIKLIDQ